MSRIFSSASQPTAFSSGHDRAAEVFARRLRAHPHLEERESRLCELIEYFGWETGHRAQFATPWFYEDDPRARGYEKALGVDNMTFQILHMYSLFNRMDPERHDFSWIYDGVLERLEALGGVERVSVLDFGTGLGQIGLSLCLAGYRTVMSDRVPDFLKFVAFPLAPAVWSRCSTRRSPTRASTTPRRTASCLAWSSSGQRSSTSRTRSARSRRSSRGSSPAACS